MSDSLQAVGQDDGLSDEHLVSSPWWSITLQEASLGSVTRCTQGSKQSKPFEASSWSSLHITPVAFS